MGNIYANDLKCLFVCVCWVTSFLPKSRDVSHCLFVFSLFLFPSTSILTFSPQLLEDLEALIFLDVDADNAEDIRETFDTSVMVRVSTLFYKLMVWGDVYKPIFTIRQLGCRGFLDDPGVDVFDILAGGSFGSVCLV